MRSLSERRGSGANRPGARISDGASCRAAHPAWQARCSPPISPLIPQSEVYLVRVAFSLVLVLFAHLLLAKAASAETPQRVAPQNPAQVRLSFAPVVKKAAPAVVNVYVSHVERLPHNPLFDDPIFQRFFGGGGGEGERVQKALGSGVIVDPSGLVVTNYHVIENATEVKI